MSKFDQMLQKISEDALPVASNTARQTTTAQPVTNTTNQNQPAANTTNQNPLLQLQQALAAAKTPDAVSKVLADPLHMQALQGLLQKK